MAEIVNCIQGIHTVTANFFKVWFGILNDCTGKPIVEYMDKIIEKIVDRHVSSCNIALKLKINHKTLVNNLSKVGLKKKLDVQVLHQFIPKTMM